MTLLIQAGDTVRIIAQGATRQGTVLTASNYGNRFPDDPPCWYIQMDDPIHGHCYWKQDADGGTVINLSLLMEDK